MSYVVEYAESVHAAFRAPNSFCHDLQHVMRGAVKNLSQARLLTEEPQQLARYHSIFTSLQNIIDTNTTMSECTAAQSDTLTMMESTANYLAAAATSDSPIVQQQRRTGLSGHALKSSKTTREQTAESVDPVGAQKLRAVLTDAMVREVGEIYNMAVTIQQKETELKAKMKAFSRLKKAEKQLEAQETEYVLSMELKQHRSALQDALAKCFPEMYNRILREYVDLCDSLLKATRMGTEMLKRATPEAASQTNDDALHRRETSVALTVDALEVHEALEEVKQEIQRQHEDSKTPEQMLPNGINLLVAPSSSAETAVTEVKASSANLRETVKGSSQQGAAVPSGPPHASDAAQASLTKSSAVSTAAPPESAHGDAQPTPGSSVHAALLSSLSVPPESSKAGGAAHKGHRPSSPAPSSSSHTETVAATRHPTDPAAPSLTGVEHSKFPFWFRYYYFDRLENSTERLAIAFGLYISYCKRLARKAGYTIPPPIMRHMSRVEMEFTTARYARHKRMFRAVLMEIFNYRKSLEVMATYVRLARDAEAHMEKHASTKNKKAYEKWNARWKEANNSIEQLRVKVFGRGAQEMVQFYDQLLQCIQGSMSDLIVTLGGDPS